MRVHSYHTDDWPGCLVCTGLSICPHGLISGPFSEYPCEKGDGGMRAGEKEIPKRVLDIHKRARWKYPLA